MFTHKYICSIVTLDVQINAWKRAICRYPWTKNYPNSNTGEKIEKFFIWHTGTSRLGQVCSFLELRTVYITGGCEMRRSLVPKRKWRETPFPLGPNHTWAYKRKLGHNMGKIIYSKASSYAVFFSWKKTCISKTVHHEFG